MAIPAKKSLGQNFLKSKEALRAIVEAGNIQSTDVVLEVGPGKGALTRALLARAKKVVAVEKDARLIETLRKEFELETLSGRFELIEGDILEFDPESLRQHVSYKLIANIPYYITGTLIQKFLESTFEPERMVLMLQKEVAQRIVARDGKESILSMSVRAYGEPRYIQTVKAKYFSPEPNVDSAILLIDHISKELFKDISEPEFFAVLKAGFAHKRKMLAGNLREAFPDIDIKKICEAAGIPEKARAEILSITDWKQITLGVKLGG